MDWLKLFDRVYIRIGEMYDVQMDKLAFCNLTELIREIAKVNPDGDIEPLYDTVSGKSFEGRTKRFVVRKVEKFIAGMPEVFSADENMATYASLTQLNRLIRAFTFEKKQISGYGLVYIYVMYTLLEDKSPLVDQCADCMRTLHDLVLSYFEDHPDDEVAEFFHGCFDPIVRAIEVKNTKLTNTEIPPRPRKHPKEFNN